MTTFYLYDESRKIFTSSLLKNDNIIYLAHGLHMAAEQIRMNFPETNSLISNIKKVFFKSYIPYTFV